MQGARAVTRLAARKRLTRRADRRNGALKKMQTASLSSAQQNVVRGRGVYRDGVLDDGRDARRIGVEGRDERDSGDSGAGERQKTTSWTATCSTVALDWRRFARMLSGSSVAQGDGVDGQQKHSSLSA
jgi:hypothetical protein